MPGLINQDAERKQIGKGEFEDTGLRKKDISKRAKAMMTEGTQYHPTYRDLRDYVYPTKGLFDEQKNSQGTKIDHTLLLDEEASIDTDAFAAGMTSGFTSPTRPWFALYIDDEMIMQDYEAKDWLDFCRDKMLDIFQGSNVYPVLTSMWKELCVFSSACACVLDDFKNVVRLKDYTAGEYYWAIDNRGIVNAFYRRHWMQVGQMIQEFGIENCSVNVQSAYQQNRPDEWVKVNWLVEENNDRIPFLKDYKNMPFRSIYWEDGEEDKFLYIGGFEEFPFLTPRWETRTQQDTYGLGGPGWKALGSVKELQEKTKGQLIALEKGYNPPLQKDSSVNGEVNTLPGGITTYSANLPNSGVKPTYQVTPDVANVDASIEKTRLKIRRFFYTDLFMMLIQADRAGAKMTATEIIEKQNERLSMLGPVLERWQGEEFIERLIVRTFNICLRNNVFPVPPEVLQGGEIKIKYTSVLAQAQQMQEIVAIDEWVNKVLTMSQADIDIKDNINFDEYAKIQGKKLGIPAKVMNSPEVIAEMRKAREQVARQQMAQESAINMADAAKKGAGAVKDMSSADMDKNSALDQTLNIIKGIQGTQ